MDELDRTEFFRRFNAAFGIMDFSDMQYEIESVICGNGEAAVKGVNKRTDEDGNVRNFCYCDVYTLDRELPEKVKSITTFVIELQKEKHTNSY
ncbi:hypothetical protein [Metaplanococcus flavidus]